MQLKLNVRGLVQGVGYRAATLSRARALGLRGWVRNEDDGSVTAVAEGDRSPLEALRTFCRQGPPYARVDALSEEWNDAEDGLPAFEIRR